MTNRVYIIQEPESNFLRGFMDASAENRCAGMEDNIQWVRYARAYLAVRDEVQFNGRLARAMMRCVSDELARLREIRWATPTAREALRVGKREGIEVEHAIPVSLIHDYVLGETLLSESELVDILRGHLVGVYITKDEHAALNKKHRSKMPEGVDWLRGDIFARYRAVGIDVKAYS